MTEYVTDRLYFLPVSVWVHFFHGSRNVLAGFGYDFYAAFNGPSNYDLALIVSKRQALDNSHSFIDGTEHIPEPNQN